MLKSYELLYIVHPDLEGTTDKVMEKVTGFIKKTDGEILTQEDWGKRKLAYKIAKNDFGVYVLVQFQTESTKLSDIERNLRLSEEILRSMIVVLPEVKEVKRRDKKTGDKKDETEKATQGVTKKEVVEAEDAEKPKAKKVTKKAVETKEAKEKKVTKKTEKPKAADEKERLKKLDEKLEELLK